MTKKVKVSKKVALAIESYINGNSERGAKISLLENHAARMNNPKAIRWSEVNEDCAILDKISLWEMAEILIHGYEVEQTMEEKIAELYDQFPDDLRDLRINSIIEFVSTELGHEIKGVNV